jgi:hypothetical protein
VYVKMTVVPVGFTARSTADACRSARERQPHLIINHRRPIILLANTIALSSQIPIKIEETV